MVDKKPPDTAADNNLHPQKSNFNPKEVVNENGIANKPDPDQFATFVDNDPVTERDIFPDLENDVYNFILKPTTTKIPDFANQLFMEHQYDFRRLATTAAGEQGATDDNGVPLDGQLKLPSPYLLQHTTATAAMGMYQFQRTAQMTYMRKMLALAYQQNKTSLTLNTTMSDMGKMMEAKLEAIKLNTAAPEARKSSLIARFRETFTNQSMIAAAQWTRNQIFGRVRDQVNKRLSGPIATSILDLFTNRADIGDIGNEVRNSLVGMLGRGSAYVRSISKKARPDFLRRGLMNIAARGSRAGNSLRDFQPSDRMRDRADRLTKFLRTHLPATDIASSISRFLDTLGGDFVINANDGSTAIKPLADKAVDGVKPDAGKKLPEVDIPDIDPGTATSGLADEFAAYAKSANEYQGSVIERLDRIVKHLDDCGCNGAPAGDGPSRRRSKPSTSPESPKSARSEKAETPKASPIDAAKGKVKAAIDDAKEKVEPQLDRTKRTFTPKTARRVRDRVLRAADLKPYADESLVDQAKDRVNTLRAKVSERMGMSSTEPPVEPDPEQESPRVNEIHERVERLREKLPEAIRDRVGVPKMPDLQAVRDFTRDLHERLKDVPDFRERLRNTQTDVGNVVKKILHVPEPKEEPRVRTDDMRQMLEDMDSRYGNTIKPKVNDPVKAESARDKLIGGLKHTMDKLNDYMQAHDGTAKVADRVNSYENMMKRMRAGDSRPAMTDHVPIHNDNHAEAGFFSRIFHQAVGAKDLIKHLFGRTSKDAQDSIFEHLLRDDDEGGGPAGWFGHHKKGRPRRMWEGTFKHGSRLARRGVRGLGHISREGVSTGIIAATHGAQRISGGVIRGVFGDTLASRAMSGAANLGIGAVGLGARAVAAPALWGAEKLGTSAIGMGAGLLGHAPGIIRNTWRLGRAGLRATPYALGGMALGALTDHFTAPGGVMNRLGHTASSAAEYAAMGSFLGPWGTAIGGAVGAVAANLDLVSSAAHAVGGGMVALKNKLWGGKTTPEEAKKILTDSSKSKGIVSSIGSALGIGTAEASDGMTDDVRKKLQREGRISSSSALPTPGGATAPALPASLPSSMADIYGANSPATAGLYGGPTDLYGGSGYTPTPVTGDVSARAAKAVDYLVTKKGWTKPQAIGIVANLVQESKLDPNAVGDNGAALGEVQWHPDRQAAIQRHFKVPDIRKLGFFGQLDALDWELRQGGETNAGKQLASATTAQQAAAITSLFYERPAGKQMEAMKRASIAAGLEKSLGSADTKDASNAGDSGVIGAGSTPPSAAAPASGGGSGTTTPSTPSTGGADNMASAKVASTVKAATPTTATPAAVQVADASGTPVAAPTATASRASVLQHLNDVASAAAPLDHDQTASAIAAGMKEHTDTLASHLQSIIAQQAALAKTSTQPGSNTTNNVGAPVVIQTNTTTIHHDSGNDLSVNREGSRSGVVV